MCQPKIKNASQTLELVLRFGKGCCAETFIHTKQENVISLEDKNYHFCSVYKVSSEEKPDLL